MNVDRNTVDGPEIEDPELLANELEIPVTDEALPAPAPTERDERKRQRRLDARTWIPRESTAVMYHEIVVCSQTIKKNWNVLFVRAQTTLYMLMDILPSTGQMEQARGTEQVVNDRLAELETELRNDLERLRALAKSDGINTIPEKSYTHSETIKVPIYTPAAMRYMRLIQTVDELYWTLDYLWMQGVLKTEYKWQMVNRWKHLLWGFVRFTTSTWTRARASLKTTQDQRNKRRQTKRNAAPAVNDAGDAEGQAAAA